IQSGSFSRVCVPGVRPGLEELHATQPPLLGRHPGRHVTAASISPGTDSMASQRIGDPDMGVLAPPRWAGERDLYGANASAGKSRSIINGWKSAREWSDSRSGSCFHMLESAYPIAISRRIVATARSLSRRCRSVAAGPSPGAATVLDNARKQARL